SDLATSSLRLHILASLLRHPAPQLVAMHPKRPGRAANIAPVLGERPSNVLVAPTFGGHPQALLVGRFLRRKRHPRLLREMLGLNRKDALIERPMSRAAHLPQELADIAGPV